MRTKTRATIEDLYKTEGKAELVHGEIEVRSENDYGPAAEGAMRGERADYFACGTWSRGTWTCRART
jgi:hypothetical protein